MDAMFDALTEAMAGSVSLALGASFAWGVLSILLSPCHLSSIPLVVGFLAFKKETKGARGFRLSFVFALGILASIAIIGAVTAALGRIMGDVGPYGRYAIAAIFIVVGLYLMDFLRLPETGVVLKPLQLRSAYLSAFLLGLVFGIALGPCTFAFMAPVLGLVFQWADVHPLAAAGLLCAFGLGHAGVVAVAGGVTARVQAYLDWGNRTHIIVWIKRAAGALVLLGGAYAVWVV
jgi:cytochrome c-type biogenesis protein